MNNSSGQQLIEQIRKKHKISHYLASKGFTPKRITSTRLSYICPLPEHQDSVPSFYVWLKEDEVNYQYCHCFGCSAHLDIIGLYAALEKISWKEALKKLGEGIDITSESELDFLVNMLKNDFSQKTFKEEDEDFSRISFDISIWGFSYLKQTEFDPQEVEFLEQLYKKVDEYVTTYNLDDLETLYDFICGNGPYVKKIDGEGVPAFCYRLEQWNKKREKQLFEEIKNETV